MGTTESIFYDDGGGGGGVVAAADVSAAAAAAAAAASTTSNPDRSGGGDNNVAVVHSRSAGMSPMDGPSNTSRQRQEGAIRRSVIPAAAAAAVARRSSPTPHRHTTDDATVRMHRTAGNRPPTKPLRRIEGWLGGSTQTGKRSLLMRLKGRDPFPPEQTSRPSSSSSSGPSSDRGQSVVDDDTITVPYRPPQGCHSFDRIQLHIKNMSKITTTRNDDDNNNDGRLPDFAVILINPLDDDLGSVHNYIYQAVIQYATRLGYDGDGINQNSDNNDGEEGGDENDEAEDKDDNGRTGTKDNLKMKKKTQGSNKPLCLCLVWNFRDLLNEKHKKRQYSMYTDRRDLLVQFVNNALKSFGVLPDQSKIVCIETSMKNCYGLDKLHQFIYRSYLEQKRYELQSILRNVEDQMETFDEGEKDETYGNEQSYKEFLTVLSSTMSDTPSEGGGTQTSSSKPLSRHENEKTSSKHEPQTPPKTSEKPQQDRRTTKNIANGASVPSSQRIVMHTKDQTKRNVPSSKVGKDALEAFLASSSDEEDEPPSSKKGNSKTRKIFNAKSRHFYADDDDDDDFFYDAEGRQHAHQDDSSHSDDSAVSDDPSSSSASNVDPAKSTPPVDASESHEDQGGKSESSDLDENVKQTMDDTPDSHRQTIETEGHIQDVSNVSTEDVNHSPTNPAANEQGEPKKSEDSIENSANFDDRQNVHQDDEDSTQSAVQEPEIGEVGKRESIGGDSVNTSENDVQETMDDGSDVDLTQTDIMSDKSEPTEVENHVNVQDDDSDDSAYLISTNSEDQEEHKSIENQHRENDALAKNEIEQMDNPEAEVFEKDPTGTDPHSDSTIRKIAVSVENEETEPSEFDHGGGGDVDEDEDDEGFMIGSTTDGNEKEGDEDRAGENIHRSAEARPKAEGTTQSRTTALDCEQSASPPEQSTGLSAAALAAIQAAQAQAEAMIELPNTSFPEKDAKKKKKKKEKDERKSKKEKKRKKSKNVDKDSD